MSKNTQPVAEVSREIVRPPWGSETRRRVFRRARRATICDHCNGGLIWLNHVESGKYLPIDMLKWKGEIWFDEETHTSHVCPDTQKRIDRLRRRAGQRAWIDRRRQMFERELKSK